MITRLTKVQLVVFALITLLGGAFVGGRYAELDRLVVDRTYPVVATFADSGGIFVGAEVTYRGIGVGKVGDLQFVEEGVEARLDLEDGAPRIPADVEARVANKSAIGEQYVDLRPRTSGGPYLADGSTIDRDDTRIPLDTATVLVDVNDLVASVDTQDLAVVVDELGQAFEGVGRDLSRILDTSMEVVADATENLDATRRLIRDSDSVLQTQIDKSSQIGSFSRDLRLLSDTLVDADPDLRRLLDEGPDSAALVDAVVGENEEDLTELLGNLTSSVEPLSRRTAGLQAIYILYPYLVQGSYSVVDKGPDGRYDASFGLVLTPSPKACEAGYTAAERPPEDRTTQELDVATDCTDPDLVPRGSRTSSVNRPPAASEGKPSTEGENTWSALLLGPSTAR